ncbi:unnamed protein product [Durusdinium trenchii]|uniref:Myosin motor domain-containing protein n=1 Tax=Durusdinium trenchii TaxID=1381693 RepID=A0ABP0SZU6_9DINO
MPSTPRTATATRTRPREAPRPDRVWCPCRLQSVEGGGVSLIFEDGERWSCSEKELQELDPVQDGQLDGVEDICTLSIVTEAALLYSVRARYFRQEIYTRVARILISVNPFRALPIYSARHLTDFQKAKDSMELSPHIFGTGHDALRGLAENGKDQAIVISGESGAGKTESAKFLLSYVAECVKGHDGQDGLQGLEGRVLQTNPILESFGNAMTTRNANSSRFGKWLDLRFSEALHMRGGQITSYLLEVTRVCGQSEGERGFHIFFQLLQARRSLPSLGLQEPSHYRYLKNSTLEAPGIDDAEDFAKLRQALQQLGFSEEEQMQAFQILAGILNLGNCDFYNQEEEDAELGLDGESFVAEAARKLKLCEAKLRSGLLRRTVVTGRDEIETFLRLDQARAARDGLARMLYGRLFDWLIRRMNATLAMSNGGHRSGDGGATNAVHSSERLLGILDISGFESFATNSLEQLLINLSNEQLQLQFNEAVFKSEIEDCLKEGVDLGEAILYEDNSDVVALLDGKGGVLDMLDEELTMPKATDSTFANKVLKGHGATSRLIAPKFQGSASFGIQHYAATVTYSCEGFLEKNADRLPLDQVADFLQSSELPLLQELGRGLETQATNAADASPKRPVLRSSARRSATYRFRSSLRELMTKIFASETHYVRCIKPNAANRPEEFTSVMVHEQLRYSGVLEAVRIRKQGFSCRMPFQDFLLRYRCLSLLVPGSLGQGATVEMLLHWAAKQLQLPGEPQFGKTKVFLRDTTHLALEAHRKAAVQVAIRHLQRLLRGARLRRHLRPIWPELKQISGWLQRCLPEVDHPFWCRFRSFQQLSLELQTLTELLQAVTSHKVSVPIQMLQRAADAHRRLTQELKLLQELRRLWDESADLEALGAALAAAEAAKLDEAPEVARCRKRVQDLKLQMPLCEAMRAVLGSKDIPQARQLLQMLQQAGLEPDSPTWLADLQGGQLQAQLLELVEAEQRRLQRLQDALRAQRGDAGGQAGAAAGVGRGGGRAR